MFFPLLFTIALLWRPHQSRREFEKADFSVSFYQTDSSYSVSVQVKNPLRVPVCLVRAKTKKEKLLLGSVDKVGTYSFKTPLSVESIELVDEIHQSTLTTFVK